MIRQNSKLLRVMSIAIAFVIPAVISLLISCNSQPINPDSEISDVTLIKKEATTISSRQTTLYTVEIISQGIPARQAVIRASHQQNSKGAIILTTGGTGMDFYTVYGVEAEQTIEILYKNGLEIYEVKWNGSMGWGTNAEGYGFDKALGGYAAVVSWLCQNVIDNTETIFAHGNSGGSMQIAYGLALYGLESYFDAVILSGGPPTADLRRGIFGDLDDEARWPDGLAGFALTDYIMGWKGNGDYCVNRNQGAPESIKVQLDSVSLVSPISARQYAYATRVYFVQTDDTTHADHQAQIYFDQVANGKAWIFIDSVTQHNVPATPDGAEHIRTIVLAELGIFKAYACTGYEELAVKNRISYQIL